MIKFLNGLMVTITLSLCFGLYSITSQTREAQAELKRVDSRIAAERETLEVLSAEWQLLVQPARLQRLNDEHLGLQRVSAGQILTIDDIPYRPDVELPPELVEIDHLPRRKPAFLSF